MIKERCIRGERKEKKVWKKKGRSGEETDKDEWLEEGEVKKKKEGEHK